jgi:hypothetical protein
MQPSLAQEGRAALVPYIGKIAGLEHEIGNGFSEPMGFGAIEYDTIELIGTFGKSPRSCIRGQ